jgi:AcrR family transcriptional regulator
VPQNARKRAKTSETGVRDRLLDAADRLFYREGVRAVGIDRVLAEADAAKASLYQHFGCKDQLVAWRSSFLIEYFSDTVFPRIRNMGYAAVRTNRYKLIEYRELTGMDELYDLEADPFEEHNLFGRAEAAPTLARMRSELRRLQTGK